MLLLRGGSQWGLEPGGPAGGASTPGWRAGCEGLLVEACGEDKEACEQAGRLGQAHHL